MKILVLNGPNLNFLGIREKGIYGNETYEDLVKYIESKSNIINNLEIEVKQSNHEGFLIDYLQQAYHENIDGILINPGAYTHYSYALFDAIKSVQIPTIEIHLSNIHEREEFRKISVTSAACIDQVYGLGKDSYIVGLEKLINHITNKE